MELKYRIRSLKVSLPKALEKGVDLVIDSGEDFGVCYQTKERLNQFSL